MCTSSFGMVLQDTWLFEGTVRENLVYNMDRVSRTSSSKRPASACGLDNFVDTLPTGL